MYQEDTIDDASVLDEYLDLVPDIIRQRLAIEGFPEAQIRGDAIKDYLSQLSLVLLMKPLMSPETNYGDFGWAGWIHWETSGAHFYAWETPHTFFSVDIYTCKKFDPVLAVEFTQKFFKADLISAKEF